MVKIIGGDRLDCVGLMGPGVDPHLYRATAGDVKKLNQSDVIFYNGLHLEAKLGDILENMKKKNGYTVAVTSKLPKEALLTPAEYDGLPDPHVWFDPTLWMSTVQVITETFVEMDPKHRSVYEKNATAMVQNMIILKSQIQRLLSSIPAQQRVLVTAHDAFNYYGRAFNIKVKGLQGISTESEPGARDINELANYLVENKIKAMFIESSIPKRTIEAVQRAAQSKGHLVKIGGELFSDALGNPWTPEGTYIGMMVHNTTEIANALGRKDNHNEIHHGQDSHKHSGGETHSH